MKWSNEQWQAVLEYLKLADQFEKLPPVDWDDAVSVRTWEVNNDTQVNAWDKCIVLGIPVAELDKAYMARTGREARRK